MPNWCSNVLKISHVSKDMMDRVIKVGEQKDAEGLLSEFLPCPKELTDTVAGSYGSDKERQAELELQEDLNVKKYGHKNWYDWCVNNWGTKWDFTPDTITPDDDGYSATVHFDSAWAPPTKAYEKLMELGFEIKAYYYEPGMCYTGIWDNGDDHCVEYSSMNSARVKEEISAELDAMFGISEEMAQWEEENEDTE